MNGRVEWMGVQDITHCLFLYCMSLLYARYFFGLYWALCVYLAPPFHTPYKHTVCVEQRGTGSIKMFSLIQMVVQSNIIKRYIGNTNKKRCSKQLHSLQWYGNRPGLILYFTCCEQTLISILNTSKCFRISFLFNFNSNICEFPIFFFYLFICLFAIKQHQVFNVH